MSSQLPRSIAVVHATERRRVLYEDLKASTVCFVTRAGPGICQHSGQANNLASLETDIFTTFSALDGAEELS